LTDAIFPRLALPAREMNGKVPSYVRRKACLPYTHRVRARSRIPGRGIDTKSPSETIFISGLGDWKETRRGREKNMDDVDTAATCLSMSPVDMLSISRLIYEITGNQKGRQNR